MRWNFRRRKCGAALVFLAACALLTGSSARAATVDSACTPKFPLQTGQADGWLGADAAYSIPLADGRDVWIFGDTLYGKERVVHDGIPRMVRNSIGISRCDAQGHWSLEYVIRKDADGHPRDFFTAQHPKTWYWALDGFVANHDLWVTLLCVRVSHDSKPAALGFEFCGSDLARVSGLGPDPQKWKIDYFPLVPDGTHAYPSASAVTWRGDAYIFAQYDGGTRPLQVTRIPEKGLNDPAAHLQYLADNGKWLRGFDPKNARPVMAKGTSELSVRYHPEQKQWLAVMFAPEGFSNRILLRTAPSLAGPWSTGQQIYQVPEMQPGTPGYDKNTFCYAAKEHPEFESGDLVFTYVCNTFDLSNLAKAAGIYFPQVVRRAMPAPTLTK